VFDLDALLACPVCHGDLTRAGDALTCAGCGRVYPVRRGLPRLLRDEAATPAAEPAAAPAD
jgi:uncharacterized protein YbaR (Trm112 family)